MCGNKIIVIVIVIVIQYMIMISTTRVNAVQQAHL